MKTYNNMQIEIVKLENADIMVSSGEIVENIPGDGFAFDDFEG